MKQVVRIILAAAAVAALAVPAMAADKLIVKDAGGTADVFKVDDTGTITSTSSTFFFDPVTKRMGIGTTTPSNPLNVLGTTSPAIKAQRDDISTTVLATAFNVANDNLTEGNGTAFSLASKDAAGNPYSGAVVGAVFTTHAAFAHKTDLSLRTTDRTSGSSTPVERFRISASGNVLAGNKATTSAGPLANTATDGFFYIPAVAGVPTGVPTAYTGMIPMQYDTTNSKLCLYNGGWKCITWN